jgi:phosphoribosylformylglycinamidine synthase I
VKAAVVVFPASNCDRDAATALEFVTGNKTTMLWHKDSDIPADIDLIVLPGGFSYGDYLRSGAMAAQSPIMRTVVERAKSGTPVAGICNGFQILTECGLLPGAFLRNAGLQFVNKPTPVRVENSQSIFTNRFEVGEIVSFPVANGEGNYFADNDTLDRLEGEGRVAFRYQDNPNGSIRDIAGLLNETGNVLGVMPHPERHVEPIHFNQDGRRFFESLLGAVG